MTIAELIEFLCLTIGDMAVLIDKMAERLLQSGMISNGELESIEEIKHRIQSIEIESRNNKES